ncbi:hypothetical protein K470DRAFT_217170 [Piedraia hortae CBS 480.64]|uniref:Cytochrome c oxidase assembly protein PET191 n=1 Tax=Piedraia hortae CBS 480.64 TaxID=1314780 RepID=A0A6A7C0G0_9PEZI|nr:hypothetical protein K470DRAFT_217170 [Piedraia hortae CBS 480.64]
MPSSCQDIRDALAKCLQYSPCVLIERNTPADCLKPPLVESLPTECLQLKRGYAECKRGQIDMRKRFRGNKPIGSTSKELEGEKGHMLYAGGGSAQAEKPKGDEWEKFTRNDGIEDIRKK